MCEFCKTKEISSGEIGANTRLIKFKDGYRYIEMYLNRYIFDSENIHRQDLSVEISTTIAGSEGVYTVVEDNIQIKYCPFCGEEL